MSNTNNYCVKCSKTYPDAKGECPHHKIKLIPEPPDTFIGKIVDGRFELLKKIGQGGMGSIYKAKQISTGKNVAIKVISPELIGNPKTIQRFKREVRLQAMLEHPNIVNVIDFSASQDGFYYFVMAFIEGDSLKSMMNIVRVFPMDLFITLASQICDGVEFAHSKNIVHRDLKGENIIVSSFNNQKLVKIIDFGVAKALQDEEGTATGITKEGMLIGTPSCMSPEQAKGQFDKISPQSDIYSLGVIFYKMLSGQLPFQAKTTWEMLNQHVHGKPIPLTQANPKISIKLEAVILKCLEKDPSKRYQSASKLKDDILKASNVKNDNVINNKKMILIAFASVLLVILLINLFSGKQQVTVIPPREVPVVQPAEVSSLPVKKEGSVLIISEPNGAVVTLDNSEKKEAPAHFKGLTPGAHEFVVYYKGYTKETIVVDALENELIEKKVVLVPLMVEKKFTLNVNEEKSAKLDLQNNVVMNFAWISPGRFEMGDDTNNNAVEMPLHPVILTKGFFIGIHEVTQNAWEQVMGNNPSRFINANNPVDSVSWQDCKDFMAKLNQLTASSLKGYAFRLPYEAEWEYACRAGTKDNFSGDITLIAWFSDNSNQTHPVGIKKPNPWGLYDMHGNVFEWCEDWQGVYSANAETDPKGPPVGEFHVAKGGAWHLPMWYCRSAYRQESNPGPKKRDYQGFRLALSKVS